MTSYSCSSYSSFYLTHSFSCLSYITYQWLSSLSPVSEICGGSFEPLERIRWLSRNQYRFWIRKSLFASDNSLLEAEMFDIGDVTVWDSALVSQIVDASRFVFDSLSRLLGMSTTSSGDRGRESSRTVSGEHGIGICEIAHGPSKQEHAIPIEVLNKV